MSATLHSDLVPSDAPSDLRASLVARDASVTRVARHAYKQLGHKVYLWATSPTGALFAWYSTRPAHAAVVEFEARVREAVGSSPPLCSPPLLERGELWRLERAITPEPLKGPRVVEALVASAEALADFRLPCEPPAVAGEARIVGLRRRLHTLVTPLPAVDFLRSRGVMETSRLPRTTSHGTFDFHHVLFENGIPWVIDWDQAGSRPAGFDLMMMWAALEDEDDREQLFEGAVRSIGAHHRSELLRLRYAVLTKVIATTLADPDLHSRDPARGRTLLPLLEVARREAFED